MKWHEVIRCGCKINLRLKVTGVRPDGLHSLSGYFLFLEHPGDRLTVAEEDAPGIRLDCPGHPELSGSGNLACRAAALYAERSGIPPRWRLTLEKIVPVAAGLGGGSADAGAVLAALNRRFRAFSREELTALAFSLGADVPFFLDRRSAWVSGAGETMEFMPPPDLPEVLIVNPGFPTSSKWAFTHLPPEAMGGDDPAVREKFRRGEVDWRSFCINDLAAPVMGKFPLLGIIGGNLAASGALTVQMSGSGSSLFALFAGGAAEAAASLRSAFGSISGLRIFTGGREF